MTGRPTHDIDQAGERPLGDLRTHGLLWLINRVVFHPRGFALALNVDDAGDVTGWGMLGDGSEPWQFGTMPDGAQIDDQEFVKVEAFLEEIRTRHAEISGSSATSTHKTPGQSAGPGEQLRHPARSEGPGDG